MKYEAMSNEYKDDSILREIFAMDLIESGWRDENGIDHRASLGHGGNICKVCGAPIIVFVNSQSTYTVPFHESSWVVDKTHLHLSCPTCGYLNDITELYEPAITPILAELNIKRLETCMSCQGHPHITQQYSEHVRPEDFKVIMKNRWNGGGDHMWISFKRGQAVKQICEKYPLPEHFRVCGKGDDEIYDIAFIKTNFEDRNPIEERMALYKWAVSLPRFNDYDLSFIKKVNEFYKDKSEVVSK